MSVSIKELNEQRSSRMYNGAIVNGTMDKSQTDLDAITTGAISPSSQKFGPGERILYGNKASLSEMSIDPSNESKVLVIYTGGTIGMVHNTRGKLAPTANTMEKKIRSYPHMHDSEYAQSRFGNVDMPPVVLPDCREKQRVLYWVYEYKPLLDSCDMTMGVWQRIAEDIKAVYDKFDGFVVLHGTDTLGYTASALSFMMESLGKPVIITGSQIPLFETRSDGRDNFISSLILAGCYHIPEVTVFFNNKLFRGNRTIKVSSGSLDAFNSPNLPPLAITGVNVSVNKKLVFHCNKIAKFHISGQFAKNVTLLRIFPSITAEIITSFLRPPVTGAVIQTYGAGNMPLGRRDIVDALKEATDRGVLIVNITQCHTGGVEAIYETGQILRDVNVLPGFDMTPEAALTKLSYVIGCKDWDYDTKMKMMMTNLRGEMTLSSEEEDVVPNELLSAMSSSMKLSTKQEQDHLREFLIPPIFFSAVSNSDIGKLEDLHQQLTSIDISCPYGDTPLHIACSEGDVEVVTWLLKKGCSVHTRNKAGDTPLWVAVMNNHIKVMFILKQAGAHLIHSDKKCIEKLIEGGTNSDESRLRSLNAVGLDMSLPDPTGRTALHAAATVGSVQCVEFLLSCNASVINVDKLGLTPVDCALRSKHLKIADIMERHQKKRTSK